MESKSWEVLIDQNCANIKGLQQWMHHQSHLLATFGEHLQLLVTLGQGSTIATSKVGRSR